MWKLVYTSRAVRDIKKLDLTLQKRLKIFLEKLSQNPLSQSKKLTSSDLGQYRARLGNYRIIFDIDHKEEWLVILKIGHRKEIYRS